MDIPRIYQQIDGSAGGPLLDTHTTTIPHGSILTVIGSVSSQAEAALVCSTIGAPVGLYDGSTLRAIIPAGWNDYLGVQFGPGAVVGIKSLNGSDLTASGAGTDTLAIQLVQL